MLNFLTNLSLLFLVKIKLTMRRKYVEELLSLQTFIFCVSDLFLVFNLTKYYYRNDNWSACNQRQCSDSIQFSLTFFIFMVRPSIYFIKNGLFHHPTRARLYLLFYHYSLWYFLFSIKYPNVTLVSFMYFNMSNLFLFPNKHHFMEQTIQYRAAS